MYVYTVQCYPRAQHGMQKVGVHTRASRYGSRAQPFHTEGRSMHKTSVWVKGTAGHVEGRSPHKTFSEWVKGTAWHAERWSTCTLRLSQSGSRAQPGIQKVGVHRHSRYGSKGTAGVHVSSRPAEYTRTSLKHYHGCWNTKQRPNEKRTHPHTVTGSLPKLILMFKSTTFRPIWSSSGVTQQVFI